MYNRSVDQTSKKGCTLLIYSHNNKYFILKMYILLIYTNYYNIIQYNKYYTVIYSVGVCIMYEYIWSLAHLSC